MSEEGHSKTLLVGFINRVKSVADEIKDLQGDITDVCKEAKQAGFDPTKIREVVRWLQKIDKHGREKVDDAEAIFDLYRSTVDGQTIDFDKMMDVARDRALVAMFAGDDQVAKEVHKKRKGVAAAAALARAAKQARGYE
jgi:uncharacterized protein (UPF0335 family)